MLPKRAGNASKDVSRIDEIEVKFNRKSKYDKIEYARQLANQEAGMNKLTVDEYLKNRAKYLEKGRAAEGKAAQKLARQKALQDKIKELRRNGMSAEMAEDKANKWIKSQAALHDPDQIAGGNPLNVTGMGDRRINSSIGSQWRTRIDYIDELIKKFASTMTDAERKNTYLNMKLRC